LPRETESSPEYAYFGHLVTEPHKLLAPHRDDAQASGAERSADIEIKGKCGSARRSASGNCVGQACRDWNANASHNSPLYVQGAMITATQ
jgi:hypothetical protein